MINTAELRPKIKKCLKVLEATRPVVFGQQPLIDEGIGEEYYGEGLHGPDRPLVQVLADRIDIDEGGGTYLFSGNRGTGKTTELMRLAEMLREFNCEVFYVDMAEYLNLTMAVEITDFSDQHARRTLRKNRSAFWRRPGQNRIF